MRNKKFAPANSFNSKLAAYSATATAALALAPATAEAQGTIQNITDLSVRLEIPLNAGIQMLNFNAGPFQGFLAGNRINTTDYLSHHAFIGGQSAAQGILSNSGNALKLAAGTHLAGRTVLAGNMSALLAGRSSKHGNFLGQGGSFAPPANGAATGYVGFQAVEGGHTYYGWLRIKVHADSNDQVDEISLVAKAGDPAVYGAYDLKDNLSADNFRVGDIAAVPEPSVAALGGLGLLALGATGLRELRRRKKAEAKI